MVLKTRTPFASYVAKSIQLSRLPRTQGRPTPTFFPIPLPFLQVFGRMPLKSPESAHSRHTSQAIHIMVMALNFWYAGDKYGDLELLRRNPSSHHQALYSRIRVLFGSEGACEVTELPKAGRRFPELVARLGELSAKLTELGAAANPYDKKFPGVPVEKTTDWDELKPYRDLDPDRIKLFGKGMWDATDYLSDNLVTAYREPDVLLHHGLPGECPKVRDSPEAVSKLAKKWDDLGLLHVHAQSIDPNAPVRIFGAMKDATTDRQIGDRRGRNSFECRIGGGPSHDLPSGAELCQLYCNPNTSELRISIADRKDFYHQLWVTESRAVSDTIAPSVPLELLKDTKAYTHYMLRNAKKYHRIKQGDRLEKSAEGQRLELPPGHLWVAFASVLQGDHSGVEIATEAHTSLLQSVGLLTSKSQLLAGRPHHTSSHAQGLVIDDFFSISVEDKGSPASSSQSYIDYTAAKEVYRTHDLLGSPHKDIIAETEGRAIGAYLNSSSRATSRGIVSLAAPPEKRLALAYLTLQTCQLSHTSDALHLCLVGGWVSILGYRRPMMSLLNRVFHVVDLATFDRDDPKLIPLSRAVANELTMLAVLMPLAMTDLAVPYAERVFCADASLSRGAVLSAPLDARISEILWKAARSKGGYSRLLTQSEVALERIGEPVEAEQIEAECNSPERPWCYSFEFLELFAGASKISHFIAEYGVKPGPPLDLSLSKEYNLEYLHVISWLTWLIAEKRLKAFALGPPCTTFSIMRRPRLRDKTKPYGYEPSDPQTSVGNNLAHRSFQLAKVGVVNEAVGFIETPFSSYMKHLPPWQALKSLKETAEIRCDSCRFGSPHLKSFRLLGINLDMSALALRCQCTKRHVQVQGAYTKGSAVCVDELARTMARVIAEAMTGRRNQVLREEVKVEGLENQLTNEVMQTAEWEVLSDWVFKKPSHINILEEAAILRLCSLLAREAKPLRFAIMVDSNVVRCATAKGRTSSRCLGSVLKRVTALCVAAGFYISIPFCPARLNASDDPTRGRTVRCPIKGWNLNEWDSEDIYELASLPKTKRWASNWIRIVIGMVGPEVLHLRDRSIYRQVPWHRSKYIAKYDMDFDASSGFPGEGPTNPFLLLLSWCIGIFAPRLCRWTFSTETPLLPLPSAGVLVLLVCLGVQSACLLGAVVAVGAHAMPIHAQTPGEYRRAAERSERPQLPLGRPVTQATTTLRARYWSSFHNWANEEGYDIDWMLAHYHEQISQINAVLVQFGRALYCQGKTYNQFAETINALTDRQPVVRRLVQGAWDLGYAWSKAEPSRHHIAMPFQVLLALIAASLLWGWRAMAGSLALGFGALLRPGEILSALRADLLLPSDLEQTSSFAILSIREPKSRFTTARHQAARLDASDLLEVAELAFRRLDDQCRLWPFSGQTFRMRFRALLTALRLPTQEQAGLRSLDPGSLRTGGATWIMQVSENAELCRRRGRWASMRMMDVYVQETMAVQYLRLIPEASKQQVLQVAYSFRQILDRVKEFDRANIPEDAWFLLPSQRQKP
eukprot:Skav208101  [mRNA]  locus=scaffold1681:249518:254098:- [translate_table: standard]